MRSQLTWKLEKDVKGMIAKHVEAGKRRDPTVKHNPYFMILNVTAKQEGKEYIGETSHSFYEGSREHMKDAEDFSHGSHIVKHWMNDHVESD